MTGSFAVASAYLAPLVQDTKVLDDETVSPGVLGLAVFLLLALATFLLVRSMNKQLRKVPPSFEPELPTAASRGDRSDDQPDDPTGTTNGSGRPSR